MDGPYFIGPFGLRSGVQQPFSSASDWWEYTKSCFKENAKIFSKNCTTQENMTILRLKWDYKTYKKENFKPEIKPMTENLQDDLYQLENKQAKGAKLRANIRRWRANNATKLSSKYLKDRMCKIKQYLNYILMIINQNILAILRTLLNLPKKERKKNFHSCCYWICSENS